jgi:hypothetical protein
MYHKIILVVYINLTVFFKYKINITITNSDLARRTKMYGPLSVSDRSAGGVEQCINDTGKGINKSYTIINIKLRWALCIQKNGLYFAFTLHICNN